MEPPVLAGVFANKVLDGFCIFGRYPVERIVFVRPFFGEYCAFDTYLEEEAVAYPPAVPDSDWDVVCDCQQGDALVGACLSAEEGDEYALSPGVLVDDEAQCIAGRRDTLHDLGGAPFVNDSLAGSLAKIIKIPADKPVIQWSRNAVDSEIEQAEQIAHDLEIAIMGGDHQKPLTLFHEPFGVLCIDIARVLSPIAFLDKPGSIEHIHRHHRDMLKASLAGLLEPLLILVRITGAKMVDRSLAAAVIVFPEHSAEKAGEIQRALYVELV